MEAFAAVVFDFDGTLVDSAALKRAGYRAGLAAVGVADTPDAWEAYDRHRFSNRSTLLSRCFADLTGAEPGAEEKKQLFHGYTDHVMAHPDAVHVFPGIARFADRCRGLPLFVSSNAPMGEVGATCERLGLRRYFAEVYGHPVTKESAIRQIARDVTAEVGAVLYVGDHPGDQRIAVSVGAHFVHLDPPGEFVEEVAAPSLRSLDELGDLLFGVDG